MAWIRARGALLIGAAALAVAASAIGVAVASGGSTAHHRYVDYLDGPRPLAGRPLPPGPGGGWFGRGLRVAPRFELRGRVPTAPKPRRPILVGPPRLIAPTDAGVLHGQFTVRGPHGRDQVMDVQRGVVTKLSDGSITVKSSDGFTATYALKTKVRDLKVGDTVRLRATVTGKKAAVIQLSAARTAPGPA